MVESMHSFAARMEHYRPVIAAHFWQLYERTEHNQAILEQLWELLQQSYAVRKPGLRRLDELRLQQPDWYLSNEMIGVTLYVDLFADTLQGIRNKIMYFKELGITYIHLLPIFQTRPGQDDGGYAVSSFQHVHEKLGTMADLEQLIDEMHAHGMSICVDFIMNHTAKEHEWALRARAGEAEYEQMYFMYDSYEIPAAFEQSLPQIFPDTAPGNFTYYEDMQKWVFTTFYEFQWDLNYRNPMTLLRVLENILFLCNVGVDVFRIDAIRHIWKEVGTDCSSLPETYVITDLLKACVYVTSAGVVFLGEATTTLNEVIKYMGTEDRGCQLMYNVAFLTSVWNSLATEDTRYMRDLIAGSPQLPAGTCWKNYLRCHDDLGFVMDRQFAEPLGIQHSFQESQLISFYKGDLPGSFSVGELYCFDPRTRYSRISGTLASFCGLQKALTANDWQMVDDSLKRILLIYSMLFAYEGLPLLYAGDELGQLNDDSYKQDEAKKPDSRWLHRFPYPWSDYAQRLNGTTVQGRIYQGLQRIIQVRKATPLLAADIRSCPLSSGADAVYVAVKTRADEQLLIIANFANRHQTLQAADLRKQLQHSYWRELLTGVTVDVAVADVNLRPYQFMWLSNN